MSEKKVASSGCESPAGARSAQAEESEEYFTPGEKGAENAVEENRMSSEAARGRREDTRWEAGVEEGCLNEFDFRRIGVAVDGSSNSKAALLWAVKHWCNDSSEPLLPSSPSSFRFSP
eukprot:745995-Hanusia_phi.AAC.7